MPGITVVTFADNRVLLPTNNKLSTRMNPNPKKSNFSYNQFNHFKNDSKYLGMNLEAKLRWKHHIKKKREELDINYR